MRPTTKALLRELGRTAWFARVGMKERDGVLLVASWQEAGVSRESAQWRNAKLEANNLIGERLQEIEENAYHKKWSKIVAEVRPSIREMVPQKLVVVPREQRLAATFVNGNVGD